MADHTASAIAVEDIVVPQGATESSTWPTAWAYAEGAPIAPPTGWPGSWTARMLVRDFRGAGSTVLATLHSPGTAADGTLTLGTTVLDDGFTYALITPAIPPATSAAWDWADTDAVYDVEVTNGTRILRLVEGTFTLSSEVTTSA